MLSVANPKNSDYGSEACLPAGRVSGLNPDGVTKNKIKPLYFKRMQRFFYFYSTITPTY